MGLKTYVYRRSNHGGAGVGKWAIPCAGDGGVFWRDSKFRANRRGRSSHGDFHDILVCRLLFRKSMALLENSSSLKRTFNGDCVRGVRVIGLRGRLTAILRRIYPLVTFEKRRSLLANRVR